MKGIGGNYFQKGSKQRSFSATKLHLPRLAEAKPLGILKADTAKQILPFL